MARPKKIRTNDAEVKTTVPMYEGVRQVGDASLFDDRNAHLAETMIHRPQVMVRPNDLVYKNDPTKRFKFALFDDALSHPGSSDLARHQAAANLDRLRTKGYFKVTEDDFVSPTGRFELIDGAWCYGSQPWYAIPIERYRENRRERAERIGEVTQKAEALQGDIDAAGDGNVTSFAEVTQTTGVVRRS